jgi:hypothetical protein
VSPTTTRLTAVAIAAAFGIGTDARGQAGACPPGTDVPVYCEAASLTVADETVTNTGDLTGDQVNSVVALVRGLDRLSKTSMPPSLTTVTSGDLLLVAGDDADPRTSTPKLSVSTKSAVILAGIPADRRVSRTSVTTGTRTTRLLGHHYATIDLRPLTRAATRIAPAGNGDGKRSTQTVRGARAAVLTIRMTRAGRRQYRARIVYVELTVARVLDGKRAAKRLNFRLAVA